MIIFELTNSEAHPVYQEVEISNGNRQYDFLRSIVSAAVKMGKPFLSQSLLRAFNFHAIACLHTNASEFRPCEVIVGAYHPPEHYRVPAQMDDFINNVNWLGQSSDPVVLAAYVLWRLNHIHPFINGNGRTARAAAFFILCVRTGGWLAGEPIFPELLRRNRDEYVRALQAADASLTIGPVDLSALHGLLVRLLNEQTASVSVPSPSADSPPTDDPPDAPAPR